MPSGWKPLLYFLTALVIVYLGLSYLLLGQIVYQSTTRSPSRAASIEEGIDISDELHLKVESNLPDSIDLDIWLDRRRTHRMFGLFGIPLGYAYYDDYCTVNIANVSGTKRLLIRADEMTHSGAVPALYDMSNRNTYIRKRSLDGAVIEVFTNMGYGKLDTLGQITIGWSNSH